MEDLADKIIFTTRSIPRPIFHRTNANREETITKFTILLAANWGGSGALWDIIWRKLGCVSAQKIADDGKKFSRNRTLADSGVSAILGLAVC